MKRSAHNLERNRNHTNLMGAFDKTPNQDSAQVTADGGTVTPTNYPNLKMQPKKDTYCSPLMS